MNFSIKVMRGWMIIAASLGLLSCNRTPAPSASSETASPTPTAQKLGGKILMMHYMPWFKSPAIRGEWSNHWAGNRAEHHPGQIGADGLPDLWSNYHPLIGPYDSSDPDLLECHLLEMKLAGINGVLVDWYGISHTDDYPEIHNATRAMFDATGRFGMKFAACFEDRSIELMIERKNLQPEQATESLTKTLQWMQSEWFSKPQYLEYDNRPLLLNFGPIYLKDATPWTAAFAALPVRPAFYALHHLWKKAGADGGFTWIHTDPWEGTPTPERIQERIREVFNYPAKDPKQVIVSAYPGYKDVYEKHNHNLDHRHGETLRETLGVGIEGPWPIIQLVTWNDYGEGTMIEPTHEFGYTFLEVIQQARRNELGSSFTFTADDLRLPARLYALRKQKTAPAASLDRISQLLNNGACKEARQELDKLGAAQPTATP
ncbi:MAG: hypothetical protein WCH43_03150 [Verrucomicrobiota bacterium]